MNNVAIVEGHPSLVRDLKTGAIIVSKTDEYRNFMAKRNEMIEIRSRLTAVENSLQTIQKLLETLASKE
jgi:hypothetical protein